jgi:sucrose-6-phosphate hydrolase SacC (GH32 family)
MYFKIYDFIIFASLLFGRPTTAQTTTPVSMPTGTPVPGYYNGYLRPQIHFSPPKYFMNDPNGMFLDASGTWHLYYQCRQAFVVPTEMWSSLISLTSV